MNSIVDALRRDAIRCAGSRCQSCKVVEGSRGYRDRDGVFHGMSLTDEIVLRRHPTLDPGRHTIRLEVFRLASGDDMVFCPLCISDIETANRGLARGVRAENRARAAARGRPSFFDAKG